MLKIHNFTIVGERHTGSNFLEQVVTSKFNLPITWKYGFKHWMGFSDEIISKAENTLFLCTTRNPHDWLHAFFNGPHHVILQNRININAFLFNEWASFYDSHPPPLRNKEIEKDRNMNTGQRYKNIFELRSVKTSYINNFSKLNNNSLIVRYEDMCNNSRDILNKISDIISVQPKDYDIQVRTRNYNMSDSFITKVNNNIDWTTEAHQNYYRR